MIGLEKCCITSACLQWLCHSGERTVARGPLVFIITTTSSSSLLVVVVVVVVVVEVYFIIIIIIIIIILSLTRTATFLYCVKAV